MFLFWKIFQNNLNYAFASNIREVIKFYVKCVPSVMAEVSHQIEWNGFHSSFRLKTRFWGHNDENFNNFGFTPEMLLMTGK